MSGRNFNPADAGYVEVKDRIAAFIAAFPQGSLQSEIVHLKDGLVVLKAYAFRSPDDPRPGIGHSQMAIPGPTSFTKDSEIENAETSAWGRAIAALGFEVKKSVASANEVRNKQREEPVGAGDGGDNEERHSTVEQREELKQLADSYGLTKEELGILRKSHTNKAKSSEFTVADIKKMTAAITEAGKVKQATGGVIEG